MQESKYSITGPKAIQLIKDMGYTNSKKTYEGKLPLEKTCHLFTEGRR